MLDQITPLILSYNEAPNIERTLSRLKWAKEIVVVDSVSTDETCDLVRKLPQTTLVQRRFDNHTNQWNFGLDQVRTEWVLSLDADYLLTHELIEELRALPGTAQVDAYYARFKYCIHGRPLRGSLYPPRAVLFRRDSCRYVDNGHTQTLHVKGASAFLKSWIHHDDRKPLDRWLREQDRYARLEVEYLMRCVVRGAKDAPQAEGRSKMEEGRRKVGWADRVRKKIVFAPCLVFFYTLLGQGLIFDGWPGWFYVFQRTYAELLLSLRLLEAMIEDRK